MGSYRPATSRATALARIERAADRARTTRDAWLRRLAEDCADRFEQRALRDELADAEAELIRVATSRTTCATVRVIRCGAPR